ncbi:uncharacterized protein MELLADRAFT_77808 [Melampsora larici-populina 98AG31]|uniref:BZIP domain-containing protein n=1 Tax=Melampsora larici-populina (strain 98AG31 / pathotype 3-4-7) TaxID=747676 RepID=F4RM68_MELLP|nr:uncharacterized protein MELLADRAFT_77808 [Melampsora larici-populina 98AG31]EGG06370.1 hypothetical protein MELLADRAFT_77808 [Melampsora larici-populina 98AG31]
MMSTPSHSLDLLTSSFIHSTSHPIHSIPISSSSPTPSSSNSDISISSKRKRLDELEPKPNKSFKSLNNYDHLPFDPFNPHPGMTKEERKMARMIRNRTAAQASRDRKKEHVTELEARVKELESQLLQFQSQPCPHQSHHQSHPVSLEPSPSILNHSISNLTFDLDVFSTHSSNQTHSNLSDAIDPSIILSPSSKDSVLPSSDSTDSKSISSAPSLPTTLSPAQAEYLSTVRIHLLEEENAQLKARLAFELKRSSEPSTFSEPFTNNITDHQEPINSIVPPSIPINSSPSSLAPFELDDGLLGLILKEEELENLLNSEPNSSLPSSMDWNSILFPTESNQSSSPSSSSRTPNEPNPNHESISTHPSFLDPTLISGEKKAVTPLPLRSIRSDQFGPVLTDCRLVASEEEVSLQRINWNLKNCVAQTNDLNWMLMWSWLAWNLSQIKTKEMLDLILPFRIHYHHLGFLNRVKDIKPKKKKKKNDQKKKKKRMDFISFLICWMKSFD